MSRRRCDEYETCKECDCYSQYTEKLKEVMQKNSYEDVKRFLSNSYVYYEKLTDFYEGHPKFKKEFICMMHYYNPNGIYD